VRRLFRAKALPLVYGAPAGIDYLQGIEMTVVMIFFARKDWLGTKMTEQGEHACRT
jgi:hypothetical protein